MISVLFLGAGATAPGRAPAADAAFIRGDAQADGLLNLSDALFTLFYLFAQGTRPSCLDAADADDDGSIRVSDPIHTLSYLFRAGPPPNLPYPACGRDGTPDSLDCLVFPWCSSASWGEVVLSEFLAVNQSALRDGEGAFSDWIEIANLGEDPVDLQGFSLTDDPALKARWTFHHGGNTVLPPGGFLVVFASGQERSDHVDSQGRFHTNFRLDGGGEYLALVGRDGETVVWSFSPRFPPQRPDISCGVVRGVTAARFLVSEGHAARWLVSGQPLPEDWTRPEFDARGWDAGPIGLGYETRERGIFTGKFETDVEGSLRGVSSSLHLRVPFTISDPAVVRSLTLWMRYDDGFVAYLNGAEAARANAPPVLSAASRAASPRPDEEAVRDFVPFDASAARGNLVAGLNVLAIQALSADEEAAGFLVLPVLEAVVSGDSLQYFPLPTPGAPNGPGLLGIVADTEFSADRGLHLGALEVAMTTATPGAAIRYTLDGTAPSATRGALYSDPLCIESTSVLRAAAFREGFLPTDIDTQTYLFLSGPDGVIRQRNDPPGYPRSWAGYPADYEMDPEVAAHPVHGPALEDDLRSLPSFSIVADPADLFGAQGLYTNPEAKGLAWERPASLELFSSGGEEEFQVDCGLRMQGGVGRQPEFPKHSFRAIFRDRYGAGKLRHDLWRNQPHGASGTDSFDKLLLRGGFNNTFPHWYNEQAFRAQYVRDQWARDLQQEMGHPSTRGRYVHLYLNGMYWGLYNLGERPDEDHAASYSGGGEDDYDVVKDGQVRAGDSQAWNELLSLVGGQVTKGEVYAEIERRLDLVNLVDYVLENFYFGNTDWDNHNWVAIRKREEGGLFRFYAWDSEFAISLSPGAQENVWDPIISFNVTSTNRSGAATGIFHRLRANQEFLLLIADRMHRHFFNDGALTPTRAAEAWLRRAAQVDRAIGAESARWGDFRRDVISTREPAGAFPLLTRDHYLAHQRFILERYFPVRTGIVFGQLQGWVGYPDLAPPHFEPHGGKASAGLLVSVTTARGKTYSTTDGTDPRLRGGEPSPRALLLVDAVPVSLLTSAGAVRYLVPQDGGLALDWALPTFNDVDWNTGSTALGFDLGSDYDPLIATDVEAEMLGRSASIYLRVPFRSPEDFQVLTLRARYDDGFVAYLNGAPVAVRNGPAVPRWDSAATSSRSDALAMRFEEIDLGEHRGLLRPEGNVLALHGLNRSASDSDFLLVVELLAERQEVSQVLLERTTVLKARTLFEGQWSPLSEALFRIDDGLRITELMYHPPPPTPAEEADGYNHAEDFEFIEVFNAGEESLRLEGVRFTQGVSFVFGALELTPGGRAVLASNPSAFERRYGRSAQSGVFLAGQYEGRLSNAGERITVLSGSGEAIIDFRYDDGWYPATDGQGRSLVAADPLADPSALSGRASWRPSARDLGSPGRAEP